MVKIWYYGQYLTFLIIPFSILFFFLAKLLSSTITNTKKITLYISDLIDSKVDETSLKRAFYESSLESNNVQAVKGLPLAAEIISKKISKQLGIEKRAVDGYYLIKKAKFFGITEERSGFINKYPISSEAIVAHKIYQKALNFGSYKIKSNSNLSVLIKENGLIKFSAITELSLFRTVSKANKIIILVNEQSNKLFDNTLSSFTNIGSITLLLKLNDQIDVV